MGSRNKILAVAVLLVGMLVSGLIIYSQDIAKLILCGSHGCFIIMSPPPLPPAPWAPPPPLPAILYTQYGEGDVLAIGIGNLIAKRVQDGLIVRDYFANDEYEESFFTAIPNAEDFQRFMSSDGARTPYFRAGNNVYIFKYMDTKSFLPVPFRIVDADISTFVPGINEQFSFIAKDKFRVYVNGIPDSSIDTQSLTYIPGHPSLLVDAYHLYHLSGGNSPSYEVTEYTPPVTFYSPVNWSSYDFDGYFKDKNGVYYQQEKMVVVDSETFDVFTSPVLRELTDGGIRYSYARDKNNVYYAGLIVPNADPDTFTPVDNGGLSTHYYGKDAQAVYEGTVMIPNLDPKTVKILWKPIYEGCGLSHYVKDETLVFYERTQLVGADAQTFMSLENGYGEDKNGIWQGSVFRPDLLKESIDGCNYG